MCTAKLKSSFNSDLFLWGGGGGGGGGGLQNMFLIAGVEITTH